MNQTCDKKIEQHGLVAHDCGNALICKILAEKDVGKEEDRRQVISLLFEAF
jgi:hypothetical protein